MNYIIQAQDWNTLCKDFKIIHIIQFCLFYVGTQ